MQWKINDYVQISDIKTKDVIVSGKISKITENPCGISVDGVLFLNPNSDKFDVIKINKTTEIYVKKDLDSGYYSVISNNNIDNTFDYDMFMWNEIEEEVKPIIDLLNSLDFIETYSSCSGHGIVPPYVDFYVHNWDKFLDMLDFLKKIGVPSKTSKHRDVYTTHRFVIGVEGRGTVHLESTKINSKFEQLCAVLNKYIRHQEMKQ